MAMTLPIIPSKFPCPAGDIISLPTKKELVDALNKIAQIPHPFTVLEKGYDKELAKRS